MHELVKRLLPDAEAIEKKTAEFFGNVTDEELEKLYEESVKDLVPDTLLQGKIIRFVADEVVIDVGCKSEGTVPLREFSDPSSIDIGDTVEVLLEAVEDESGIVVLSKFKADRIRGWEKLIETKSEGDLVQGRVMRKIKGGLLVDVGVPVFLPASQVDIRRIGDIGDYVGKDVECKILKIDEERRNIVVSRRRLIEEQREQAKAVLMSEITEGDMRKGIVKNIADFGAFVDLGGIDGLLHITDMSWGRISHPTEMLAIDDEIEVKIIGIDRERERIALGLKQKSESPWKNISERYPVGNRVRGEVVNIMTYGAFVKIEEGVEGLVHISEMSWTKRINHPSEVVHIGEEIEVVVLDINVDKQEISLGIKQTEVNPWTLVSARYPIGTVIEGRVRNLTNYGAFIEIEEGIDGLLHISDMSWTKKVNHPSEVIKKGETIRTVILSVDQEKKRVALGLKQLFEDPWENDIPQRYQEGEIVNGVITKLASFGAFVELEPELEGLLHISEMSNKKIVGSEDAVQVGQAVQLKVIKVDSNARKIGLSLKRLEPEEAEAVPTVAPTESAGPVALEITPHEAPGKADEAADAEVPKAEEPKAEAPAEEPKAKEPVEEPKAEVPAEEPKAEVLAEEPEKVGEAADAEAPKAEEPKAEAPAEEPNAERPVEEPKAEVPAEEESREEQA